ncbi:zinc finger FYVE domain-containing protein 26 homolog [Leptopilina heterotoma]|uniref:zinc finger FYVE domain-containing protein 26 homolog n=1 Tax=Leptopilina heterotoma TaxID=63436 RepID=UPI001CA97D0D|nr:zinc finger FYVE domain-containing protein 26 homolog [Leptopilina heterotoma]
MSKQFEILDIDKCIISRLWYTASVILNNEIHNDSLENYTKDDVNNLRTLITSSVSKQDSNEIKWISSKLLLCLDKANSAEVQKELESIQFAAALKLIDDQITDHVEQELNELFEALTKSKNRTENTKKISQASLKFLETNLQNHPSLACWLINQLLCIWPTTFSYSDEILQDLYSIALKSIIQKAVDQENDDNFNEEKISVSNLYPKKKILLNEKNLGTLLCILSKLELTEKKEDELIKWLFPLLLQYCDTDAIKLALYSRKNGKFFNEWDKFLDNLYARSESPTFYENAKKISDALFFIDENNGKCSINHRELSMRILRRKTHWMSDILELCNTFLTNGDYEKVSKLLSCTSLKNLWPSLMFHFITSLPHIPIITSIETWEKNMKIYRSLNFLHEQCTLNSNNFIFSKSNGIMKQHLKIIHWILESKRNIFSPSSHLSSSTTASQEQQTLSVKKILLRLQNSSCLLTVLKSSVNLHEENYHQVQELLKDTKDASNTFHSYFAMLSALKGILACNYYKSKRNEIEQNFQEMEKLILDIKSLDLRLEVMENIFSLLFLRLEDFADIKEKSSDDDEKATSALENIEQKHFGFAANKYTIRELMEKLKNCSLTIGIEIANLKKRNCNENFSAINKRLTNFSNAIADALWKLEFLTSDDFVKKNENDDNNEEAKINVSGKFNFSIRRKKKAFFYKINGPSSSDEEFMKSDLEINSESGSLDNAMNLRRRKRKIRNFINSNNNEGRENNSKFIINFMLMPRESWILQCLWKRDHFRAQQIIEMFHMKGSQLDGEVRFSNAIRNFRRDLNNYLNPSDVVDSPAIHSILHNIKQAAHEGFQTSRITGQLETFLASQDENISLLNNQQLTKKEILTITILDLALTMGMNRSTSMILCDVAAKHLKSCRNLENTNNQEFFTRVHQLLLLNDFKLNSSSSLMELFADATIPLNAKHWKEKNNFWLELEEKLQLFKNTQNIAENFPTDNNSEKKINKTLGENYYQELMRLCDNGNDYLKIVYSHLKILQTIINDKNLVLTETNILKNPLDSYFGHEIFDLNVEPSELESIANKLQVNLVHSILVNCCPKLSCDNETNCQEISNSQWGIIVLNSRSEEIENPQDFTSDPNLYVSEILTDLLKTLRKLSTPNASILTAKDLLSCSKNAEIQLILQKTQILAALDLSELLDGHHTLAFFLNLWNLLFLHCILYFWSKDTSNNDLRHFISLMIIGYEIGDLGFVTLATLRVKLLGDLNWNYQFFHEMESLNELAWQDLDLMMDSRSIFAMAHEFSDSPIIKVYSPRTLNDDLNKSLLDYLEHYKSESKNSHQFPEIIQRFTNNRERNYHQNEEFNETLKSILNIFNQMETSPSVYEYEIKFTYSQNEKNANSEKMYSPSEWKTRIIKPSLLRYLEEHCWLLSYLVERIHQENSKIFQNHENQRIACLENLLNSKWTKILSSLFDENCVLASVNENLSQSALWHYFHNSLKEKNYHLCLSIINALPDYYLAKNTELQCFKDRILSLMSANVNPEEIMMYIYQINDINTLVQTIMENMHHWPMEICEEALNHSLNHNHSQLLPQHCKIRMNETLCRVRIFRKISPYCMDDINLKNANWLDVVNCTEKTDPARVIQTLVQENKFELCLEWLEFQSFSSEMHTLITQDLFQGLLKNDQLDFNHARKLLKALPQSQSLTMCKGILENLDRIKAMRFIVEFLIENCRAKEEIITYRKALIGIEILDNLEAKEQGLYISLIKEPLLMLEQLLMNCKFETLQRTLNSIGGKLVEANLSVEHFDGVIRFYASKALDFRVAFQRDGAEVKSRDLQMMESSIDGTKEFIMPANVPTKEEWTPNDKAKECSSCKEVIFSMFNRRHHCRRCGRVVCAMCSEHRMRVSGYPNSVLVRVCKDCKLQTTMQQNFMLGSSSTASSETLEAWRLTIDDSYNQTIRDEFSFEYAPNISFCLAILNLHSDHKAYTTFLLDQCDEMKKLLQPVSGGKINPEIDHALIIKMIRSLLVAAKVKCAKLGLNAGLAHCDRFLSQVDLITTLVQSDCLALIPSDDLDDHALRKLRDLLTEKEQWTLALDVSTKSGLDTQGVWAAWGKACLKVGYFDRARDKFAHCLDKAINHENYEDWVLLSHPESSDEDATKTTKPKRETPKNSRPLKNPPLLTEILQILENLSLNGQDFKSTPNVAQEILNTLNSLKTITQGNYPTAIISWTGTIYYNESLYYLLMYGSASSILEFFVKQKEFDKCLDFVLENELDHELFFNSIYMKALQAEIVQQLLNAMKEKDTSLIMWKKYLVFICRNLEKKNLLNTLYHLQLFMRDYIRAAMTCIRFYKNEARTYSDLCERTLWLFEAQNHLEADLKLENFGNRRTRRKSVSSMQSLIMEMDASEIDKHINTISRQMEIAKFLGAAEKEGRSIGTFLGYLSDMDTEGTQKQELPTLFGNQQQKTQLAVLAILCGRDVEEGFGIAFRIMQDYSLRSQKVYSLVGHVLAIEKKINSIEQLIKCCRSSGAADSIAISDRILAHCVKLLLGPSSTETRDEVNSLIRLITDVELKISSYIESRQLKAAYLLAVKHSRANDIRRILKEADRLGQNAIKSICTKWLQQTQGSN